MEEKIKFKEEENLEYIKNYISCSLAKSLLLTIKSNTDRPLLLLSKHLKSCVKLNEQINKKKKALLKIFNSNKIKIHEEINQCIIKQEVKDLFEFVSKEENIAFHNFSSLVELIKDVFCVMNVYIGKKYNQKEEKEEQKEERKKKKKKKETINKSELKFTFTSDKCEITNIPLLEESMINKAFIPSNESQDSMFLFEKKYMFPQIIKEEPSYFRSEEDLFSNLNPFYESDSSLNRIIDGMSIIEKKLTEKQEHKLKEKDGPLQESEEEEKDKEEKEEGESEEENDEEQSIDGNDTEEELMKNIKKEDKENENDQMENKMVTESKPQSDDSGQNDEDNIEKEVDKGIEEKIKEIVVAYAEEQFLIDILDMNLKYKSIYLYEIMEKESFFLYSSFKPGDFLCIPIIFYSFYNISFLTKLYEYMKNIQMINPLDTTSNEDKQEPIQIQEIDEIKPKITKPIFNIENGKKIELCLCLDNRASVDKIKKEQITDLLFFSYFFITRLFFAEKKSLEEEVSYLLKSEENQEKTLAQKLQDKSGESNVEHVLSKFKDLLIQHDYFEKNDNLKKYMARLMWLKKKVEKYHHKILDIRKIKVECNKTFVIAVLVCFIILEYNYSEFIPSNDLSQYEWNQFVCMIDFNFIDKLLSFEPILYFEGCEIEKLKLLKDKIQEVFSFDYSHYPKEMENILIPGIVLLIIFYETCIFILDEIINIKTTPS